MVAEKYFYINQGRVSKIVQGLNGNEVQVSMQINIGL